VFTSVGYDRNGLSAPSSRGLLPTNLSLFSCLLQLPISLSMDLLLTAGEHVLRRDVADGTVQADIAETRMNSLKSLAMNCGPLSEMIRGRASGCSSLARSKMISMSASAIDSRKSQFTM
jgi:hypothetical protein